MNLKKLADKCKKCKHVDNCDKKRMAACAYIAGPDISQTISINLNSERVEVRDRIIEQVKKDLYKGCFFWEIS